MNSTHIFYTPCLSPHQRRRYFNVLWRLRASNPLKKCGAFQVQILRLRDCRGLLPTLITNSDSPDCEAVI